jgi:hypothetical protein
VRGRECEDGVHDERMGSSEAQKSAKFSYADHLMNAQNTHLGIMSAHSVIFEVLFLNISLVMEER